METENQKEEGSMEEQQQQKNPEVAAADCKFVPFPLTDSLHLCFHFDYCTS